MRVFVEKSLCCIRFAGYVVAGKLRSAPLAQLKLSILLELDVNDFSKCLNYNK